MWSRTARWLFLKGFNALWEHGEYPDPFLKRDACHLIKAVEGWNDMGLGVFELRMAFPCWFREGKRYGRWFAQAVPECPWEVEGGEKVFKRNCSDFD